VSRDISREPTRKASESEIAARLTAILPPGIPDTPPADADAPSPPPPAVTPPDAIVPAVFAATDVNTSDKVHQAQPARRLSPQERAQRRFWKNLAAFLVCIAVLIAVFYWLARPA
jgi:hypothetical protein